MVGTLYFSATGNSLYLAEQIQKNNPGEIRYIPAYEGDGSEYEKLILVSPIYSWGLPVHVYDLIPRLTKERPIYLVLNYGGMSGGAAYFAYIYAKEHGITLRGVYLMKMPENYTLAFTVPGFYRDKVLRAAPKNIAKIAMAIAQNETAIPKVQKLKTEAYLKNKSNWHLIARDFSVTADCTRCGKCVSLCPVKNISLTDGRVQFGDGCVACLGCYHRCPQKAIQYQNKAKKYRYVNPFIEENRIGKDQK